MGQREREEGEVGSDWLTHALRFLLFYQVTGAASPFGGGRGGGQEKGREDLKMKDGGGTKHYALMERGPDRGGGVGRGWMGRETLTLQNGIGARPCRVVPPHEHLW